MSTEETQGYGVQDVFSLLAGTYLERERIKASAPGVAAQQDLNSVAYADQSRTQNPNAVPGVVYPYQQQRQGFFSDFMANMTTGQGVLLGVAGLLTVVLLAKKL